MFGSLPLIVMRAPSGKYIYRGSIPGELGTAVPATTSAVMGGRAFLVDGKCFEMSFPAFATSAEAVAFAVSKGFTPSQADA
jgi:hypothetical protein